MNEMDPKYAQRVTALKRSSISNVSQSITVTPPPQYIYIDLEIFDDGNSPRRQQTIKCGRSYKLVISTSYDRNPNKYSEQRGLLLDSDVELQLYCSEFNIDMPICKLASKSAPSFEQSFTVDVPKQYPTGDVIFELQYRKQGMSHMKTATTLKVGLQGTYNLDDRKQMQSCNIDLDALPPNYVAILYIAGSSINKVDLRGWSNGSLQLRADWNDWIPVCLADCIKRRETPRYIRMKLRKFSRRGPKELHLWLKNLIEENKKQLCMIVVDCTSFETPWEILEVDEDDAYLGARARVVRWTAVQNYSRTPLLSVHDEECHGAVLAYVNNESLGSEQTTAERKVLEELKVRHHTNMQEFKKHLLMLESLKNIGLIYVADHGYDGTSIGSGSNSDKQMTDIDLEDLEMHEDERPIIFANLCDSARLMHSTNGSYSGLLEVLLARFARGYIGTLAKVGS